MRSFILVKTKFMTKVIANNLCNIRFDNGGYVTMGLDLVILHNGDNSYSFIDSFIEFSTSVNRDENNFL